MLKEREFFMNLEINLREDAATWNERTERRLFDRQASIVARLLEQFFELVRAQTRTHQAASNPSFVLRDAACPSVPNTECNASLKNASSQFRDTANRRVERIMLIGRLDVPKAPTNPSINVNQFAEFGQKGSI